jgi:hypothetical protein
MMIRNFALMLIYFSSTMMSQICEAKPIPSNVAEKLNALKEIEPSIANSLPLNPDQWKTIESASQSDEDMVAAVAVLFLQKLDNEQSRKLMQTIESQEGERGLLTTAVLRTGKVDRDLAQKSLAQRVVRWTELSHDSNLYTRLQAAKALGPLDRESAKAILIALVDEKSEVSPTANRLLTSLAEQMGEAAPPPYPEIDSSYEWFERSIGSLALPRFAGPTGDQQLHGTTPQTISPNPMPEAPETNLTLPTPSEEPPSSTLWSVIVILIVAALGLLWLLLKRRS